MDSWLNRLVLTIPNVLSAGRLLMALVAGAMFLVGGTERLAVILCVIGSATDAADGFLARRLSRQSRLGEFLDPVADKVMMTVVYVVIAANVASPLVWALVILILTRDVLVTVSRSRNYRRRGLGIAAGGLGKAKMAIQATAGCVILFVAYFVRGNFDFSYYPLLVVLLVVAVLSYVSAGRYVLAVEHMRVAGMKRVNRVR